MALDIVTGTVTTSTSVVVKGVVNSKIAVVQVYGTYTGVTFVLEGSSNGVNFEALAAVDNGLLTLVTGTITPGSSAKNAWAVSCTGLTHVQLRATGYSTGTMNVIITETDNSFLGNGLPVTLLIGNSSAANLSAATANGLVVTPPGQWVVTSAPAANTAASASKAAGSAGVKHVTTSVSFTCGQDATGGSPLSLTVNLRDGATGAGTVLATWYMNTVTTAYTNTTFGLSGLNIVGSAATAATLEFSGSGTHCIQSCTLTGYDVV